MSRAHEAAGLCDTYVSGGFSDWYLPAIWELNNLFNASFIISKVLDEDGNEATQPLLFDSEYWSSTTTGTAVASGIDMTSGIIIKEQRGGGDLLKVRAVRSF